MTWFAVYDTVTGELVSSGTIVADPLPPGLSVKEYPERPGDNMVWDPVTRDYVLRPEDRVISKTAFLGRFTNQELINVFVYGNDETNPVADRRVVAAFLQYTDILDDINLDDPLIQLGVLKLEAIGLIAPGQAQGIYG